LIGGHDRLVFHDSASQGNERVDPAAAGPANHLSKAADASAGSRLKMVRSPSFKQVGPVQPRVGLTDPGARHPGALHRPDRRRPRSSETEFDHDAVFAACRDHDVAVEINCRPERTDPPRDLLKRAVDLGCRFRSTPTLTPQTRSNRSTSAVTAGRRVRGHCGPGDQQRLDGDFAGLDCGQVAAAALVMSVFRRLV
jgi:hypothetical protein